MLAFLVMASRSGGPVDPQLIARFDQDDPPEVPFQPDERIVWRNRESSVVFFGWQAFTEVAGIGSHWAVDERGVTAFSGHCWPRATGWVHGTDWSWAAQLRSHLGEAPDLPALRELLFGHFTVVSLSAAGAGWIMPDWTNVDQLFISETSNEQAVSNRAGLCARAAQTGTECPQRSLTAAGWIIGEGWPLDQESSYWDVERPGPGSMVAIEPGQGARVIEPRLSPLYPPKPEDPAPTYEELLDEVEQDLRGTIRAIGNLPVEERVLALSGGKDSRTLLAVILSEGIQDRFQFVTYGSPERADVILAKTLADRFGLDWTYVDLSERSPEAELEHAQSYVDLVEGMTSAWSAMEPLEFAPGVGVFGTSGEGLRWGKVSSSAIGVHTVDEALANLQSKAPFDVLGVLQPDIRAYYVAYVANWFHELAETGIPIVSLNALYFHEGRMHARAGPDAVWNPRLRIDPYMTPVCIRANHRLPLDQRPTARLHLDLQRRNCMELSKLPLTASSWTEPMYAHLPDAEDYRQLQPIYTRDPRGYTWRFKNYAAYRPSIEQIVLDRDNPIHELLDYDQLTKRLASGGEHEGRARLIWGVLSAAIWMGRHERPIKLTRDS